MNRKIFFLLAIAIVIFKSFQCSADGVLESKNSALLTPWMSHYTSAFLPQWNLVPTVQTTYEKFAHVEKIPADAIKNDADASIRFVSADGMVTLFANGVRRLEKQDGTIEYFDRSTSALCSINSLGEVRTSYLDKSQKNASSMSSVDGGGLVFKSHKMLADSRHQLSLLIRLHDGLSIVFEYPDDGTIIARESTGCVEVVSPAERAVESILSSHGMIKIPEDVVFVAEGMACKDGEGISCYVMNGMKFYLTHNGTKNCFSAPSLQVQLDGLLVNDRWLSRWKFCSQDGMQYKKSALSGMDILFDASTGKALLYVNLATLQAGVFMYDEQGHYCKCNSVGGVRYGMVTPMLTYDGITSVAGSVSVVAQRPIVYEHMARALAEVK
jgi:hypothetical protein